MKLKETDLIEGWSNLDIARVLGKLDSLRLPAGAVLFRQGDRGDAMYIVQEGEIELFAGGGEGSGQSLAVLTAGDSFGEMALLTGEARSATAVAAADAVLYVMNQDAFRTSSPRFRPSPLISSGCCPADSSRPTAARKPAKHRKAVSSASSTPLPRFWKKGWPLSCRLPLCFCAP